MSFVASHYLVRVEDLHQAVEDYEQAGFNVVWGSKPEKAHNAMIYFESGGFIELFDPRPPYAILTPVLTAIASVLASLGLPLFIRFKRWLQTRGLCDFALETAEPLAKSIAAATERGARLSKIRDASRKRLDGVVTRWQLCSADSADLPFMMGPYEPPPTISSAQRAHPNGIRHLRGIEMQNPDPAAYGEALSFLLDSAQSRAESGTVSIEVDGFLFQIEPGPAHRCLALQTDQPPPTGTHLHALILKQRSSDSSQ